jgi:hypothetical protein
MTQVKTKVVRITRPIIVYGEHANAGELHELPFHLANELIGSGVAEAEDPEEAPGSVRVDEAGHRDPLPGSREPVPQRREPYDDRTPPQQMTPKQERPGAQRPQQRRPAQDPAGPGPTRK